MVPAAETKVVYLGDGKTTVFPFSFKYSETTDIKVSLYEISTDITTVLTKDYYIDTVGGTVTYPGYAPGEEVPEAEQPAILDEKHKLIIYRETELSQPVDLGDKYPLPVLEKMHDRAVMLIQELNDIIARAVKVSSGSDMTPDEIIAGISENAGKAAQSAAEAAAHVTEAAEYAAKSSNYADKAGERIEEIAGYAAAANASKNETVGYAAMVIGRAASMWSTDKAYNSGDAVVYTDGYVYQCTGYSAPGVKPAESDLWVKVKVALDDFFTVSDSGYLVPSENPTFSNMLMLNDDRYITIREA